MAVVFSLDCTETENYVKIIKKSERYADEEAFAVKYGTTTLIQSITLTSQTTQTFEYCIAKNPKNLYTLELIDTANDSWTNGAWIEIRGIYDNVVFKNMMIASGKETYDLSLNYPIMKNAEWKMTASASGTWTQYSYDDSTWTSVTLGSVTAPASSTQYYRKTFTGVADMAAYDARFFYHCGIVAYINGVQIFADNMPDTPVTATTPATGCYSAAAYRAVMRPGSEIQNAETVLAVEIHFTEEASPDVDFNAFLAALAPSVTGTSCTIVSDGVEMSSSVENIAMAFDFDKSTAAAMMPTPTEPINIDYVFTNMVPYIAGLRVWPFYSGYSAAKSLVWSGKNSGTTYNTIITATGIEYTNNADTFLYGYFDSALYKEYRLQITEGYSAAVNLYEVHPMVCAAGVPTGITFNPSSYNYNAIYDSVSISPTIKEFTGCTISPELPEGLTLNAATCTVTGSHNAEMAPTVFTMSSVRGGNTFTGTFTLQFSVCQGNMVLLRRVYGSNAGRDYFSVKNAADEVVYSISPLSTQEDNKEVKTLLCLPPDHYTILLGGLKEYWKEGSFLYVEMMANKDEFETLTRVRYDSFLGFETGHFSTVYPIGFQAQWHYHMNDVPQNWFGSDLSGWTQGSFGAYPEATNTIQLYKKNFNVASVQGFAGIVLSLRYKFGCIVYLNNHEVFRNGVVGALSTSSTTENIYDSVSYHIVSLPINTFAEGANPPVNYLQQGQNTIAIAIVSTASTKTSFFDCALRLMGHESESRVLGGYSVSGEGITKEVSHAFEDFYDYYIYQVGCESNHIAISFDNDRREWAGAVAVQLNVMQNNNQPLGFTLKARNKNEEEWTTLKVINELKWTATGEKKIIYVQQNKPYNQYRFENFIGTGQNCLWNINRLDFLSVSLNMEIPDLQYTGGQTLEIYKDIEMAEAYPNSELFYNFVVTPALPSGLVIDVNTGVISGTARTTTSSGTVYSITARKITGEPVSTSLKVVILTCYGSKSLISLVARLDNWPEEGSYKLFRGKTTTGEPVASIEEFKVKNDLNYADWCLPHDIYTLELRESGSDGWLQPAGYYMTIDVGALRFELGQMSPGVHSSTVLFSSYLPFQIEYDDWVFLKNARAPADWNTVAFAAADWTTDKTANIGVNNEITTYIRREFPIPNTEDYAVLNVQLTYRGGVVAYFNGHKVARFNLAATFTHDTESLVSIADVTTSKFHIILNTVGANTEKNVIAFELHRSRGESSTEPVLFDASGVFGVSECSVLIDSYSAIESNIPDATTLTELFDLSPVTYRDIPNPSDVHVTWTVANLEGTRFNGYAWQTGVAVSNIGFSLYGRSVAEDDYMAMLEVVDQSTENQKRKTWEVSPGIVGFREFKFEVDTPPASMTLNEMFFVYCKAAGTVCPGIDEYLPVSEGQISPASCAEGFSGYAYRECHDGVLGDVKTDKCVYKSPSDLVYDVTTIVFVLGVEGTSGKPTFNNIITEFFLEEGVTLPAGLTLDAQIGEISGIPTALLASTPFTIHGKNPRAATFAEIAITVRKGYCQPEGVFDRTDVGETAVYQCSKQGGYVGTQKRACVLGEKDGVWEKASGFCVSIVLVVVIAVVVIVIIVIVVFLIVRSSRKAKSVGGVKGKKVAKVSTKPTQAKKEVKV